MAVHLPEPVVRGRASRAHLDVRALEADLRAVACAGGCPLGRLASELAESDPAARSALATGFTPWQGRLTTGLRMMQERGELDRDADASAPALGLLAAAQGGLLLAQTARTTTP